MADETESKPILEGTEVAFDEQKEQAAHADSFWPGEPALDPDVILPPAWAFGVIYGCYMNQEQVLDKMHRLIDGSFPVDGLWIDSAFWDVATKGPEGYLDFEGDLGAFPDIAAMWGEMRKNRIKAGIWVWDRILEAESELYQEFEGKGWFTEYIEGNGWHNATKCRGGRIDFANPEAAARYKELMKGLMDQGLDFFKLDAGPAPDYVRTHYEISADLGLETRGRGLVLSHVGRGGGPAAIKRYPTCWTGDSQPSWNHPEYPDRERWSFGGLSEQIQMVANPAFDHYNYPFLTNDTGGFRSFPEIGQASDELYMRWSQFSAFGAVMEVFGSMFFEAQNAPYTFSQQAQESFRRHTHLRLRLFPYLYTHAHLTRQRGRMIIQGDGEHLFQFTFGDAFLVAPVHEEGKRRQEVWLPEGNRWIDYWTGKAHDGGQEIIVDAPVDQLPLFVRAGAIIPMRDYARAVELGTNDPLTLDIYPHGESDFTLYEDDGISTDYLSGGFATTRIACSVSGGGVRIEIEPIQGSYDGKFAERTWLLKIRGPRPQNGVSFNGRSLPEVSSADAARSAAGACWARDTGGEVTWVALRLATSQRAEVEVR